MAHDDCLFCRIANGEIPSTKLYEDDDLIVFEDINPQAPTHFLVVPRKHIPTLNDLEQVDEVLVGKMHRVAARLMQERELADRGWRAVTNCNEEAGQTVFHLHLHVLGGRSLTWPPG